MVDVDGVVADVTALHEATHERNDLSERLERVLGGVAEFVVSCEIRDGRTIWVHPGPGAERIFGGPIPEGADGPSVWHECVHPDDRPLLDEYFERLLRREPAEATYRLRGLDGVERWVWARARPHAGRWPRWPMTPCSATSPSASARASGCSSRARRPSAARASIRRRGSSTACTCSTSRAASSRARNASTRTRRSCSLDIDRLRDLNERGGHAVGDAVLRELAGRLSHSVRTYDTISHVGAGRFAVLVPDLRDGEALRRICDEIAATLTDEPLRSAGRELRVSVTAAGARAHPGTTIDALLHSAEVALATAKRSGQGAPPASAPRLAEPADDHGDAARVAASLARAAAEREGVPHEHEVGVAELAELVGRELGLPERLQGDLRLAGLLHDVGTIAVAGAVLSKPGPARGARVGRAARASEHRRRHGRPHSGPRPHPARDPPPSRALRRAGLSRPARGRGDPDGRARARDRRRLHGDDRGAPLPHARDREDALEELRRNAGTQLDPVVVEALCRVLAGESAGALAA